jgi:hypothetical protein
MAKYLDEEGLRTLWRKVKAQDTKTQEATIDAIGATFGQAYGIASLDGNGFVPLAQLGNLDTTFMEVVNGDLPTSDIKRHLYLKSENSTGNNIYSEYLYTGNLPIQTDTSASDYETNKYDATKWEKLGEYKADVDLTPYAEKSKALGTAAPTISFSTSGAKYTMKTVDGNNTLEMNFYNASTTTPGIMSAADKSKLDNLKDFRYVKVGETSIDSGNLESTLTLAGDKVTLTPDATNKKVTIGLTKTNVTDALGYTPPSTNTTYSTMGAATASAAGKSGLVPAPAAGKQTSFLRGDGTWVVPTDTDTHYASKTVVAGSSTATDDTTAALTNGNVYQNHIENGTPTSSHKISGSGATSVTADASGNIVISSTNTTYSTAGANTTGLVKGFHRTSGTATGTKTTNATNAPAVNSRTTTASRYYGVETDATGAMFVNVPWTDNNTTYSKATTSADGLMSKESVSALNGAVNSILAATSGDAVGFRFSKVNGSELSVYYSSEDMALSFTNLTSTSATIDFAINTLTAAEVESICSE